MEIQKLSALQFGHEPRPTCKGSTQRDYMWLSPEAISLCQWGGVHDIYQEHATVCAHLALPSANLQVARWPMPSEVLWDSVRLDEFHAQVHIPATPCPDMTDRYRAFAKEFERSIDGHLASPGGRLPSACYGRAQRLAPQIGPVKAVPVRNSRHGEEQMHHSLLSTELHRWFKQLRRLQSLCHALRCPKDSLSAIEHRMGL